MSWEELAADRALVAELDAAVTRFKGLLGTGKENQLRGAYNDVVIALHKCRRAPRYRCAICGAEHDGQYPHEPQPGKWGRGAAGGRAPARR